MQERFRPQKPTCFVLAMVSEGLIDKYVNGTDENYTECRLIVFSVSLFGLTATKMKRDHHLCTLYK